MSFSTSIKQPGCYKKGKIRRVLFIYYSFPVSEVFQISNTTDETIRCFAGKKFSRVLFMSVAAGR